jgi:hypothetical protein
MLQLQLQRAFARAHTTRLPGVRAFAAGSPDSVRPFSMRSSPGRVRARWVTPRARWVTLRARWVTLRARWVTLRACLGHATSSLGDAESLLGACYELTG